MKKFAKNDFLIDPNSSWTFKNLEGLYVKLFNKTSLLTPRFNDLIRFFLKSLKLLKPFVVIEKSIPALSKKKKLDGANSQCFNWERLRLLFLKGSSTL